MIMEAFVVAVRWVPEVESVTLAVKLNVPVAVGVPVMAPVLMLSVSPVGSEPVVMENKYGGVPPVAVSAEL